MIRTVVKALLPDRPLPMRVLAGPFRGAKLDLSLRHSLRKILGVYEHELNAWLTQALVLVDQVIDVGANDGYFTFGSAAALRRAGKKGQIIAFEIEPRCVEHLQQVLRTQRPSNVGCQIVCANVGREHDPNRGLVALDSWPAKVRANTLIKIDVEGAEVNVLEGARAWIKSSNCFLVEVHGQSMLEQVTQLFLDCRHRVRRIDQRPIPWLGWESRDRGNSWVVSEILGSPRPGVGGVEGA